MFLVTIVRVFEMCCISVVIVAKFNEIARFNFPSRNNVRFFPISKSGD